MPDAVREFLVRTILEDNVSGGLDKVVAQATALTAKAYTMTVGVVTKEAEKAIATLEKSAKKAANVDTSKATKGHKDQEAAIKTLSERLKSFADQSEAAGNQASSLFNKLDAGKLAVAGAAAAMMAYAKSALEMAESQRLNIDMIKDQLGSMTTLTSFISQGGQTSGTSKQRRGDLMALMAMTGYKDESEMKRDAENAEKIMSSTFGQSLSKFGVNNEEQLLKALSNPMAETSDLGRVIKSKMPEYFKAGTLATEKIKVQGEERFAHVQSDEVIEAEARRRLASRALEKIGGGVEKDKDSYRIASKDFENTFSDLSQAIGDTVRPASLFLTQLMTSVMKLVNLAPEVPALTAVVLGLGVSFATLGAVLPLVRAGIEGMGKSLLANPLGIAVIAVTALVVILSSLEKRFGLVTKAWEKFSSSEIGKDLINTVKQILDYFGLLGEGDFLSGLGSGIMKVAGWVGGLFDQIDAIYKMVKTGDLTGAVKGALGIALKISPLGMTAAILEGQLPSKKVLDLIYYVLQKMKDGWDGFTRWLSDIWDIIDQLLDPIFRLKEWVQKLAEYLLGGQGKSGSALAEAVKKEITQRSADYVAGKNSNTAFRSDMNESEELRKFLANEVSDTGLKYWQSSTGEKKFAESSPGEDWKALTATDMGITSSQLEEGKKIADEFKNPKPGVLNGGTSGLADVAYGIVKNLGDKTAAELSDLTGTEVTNTTRESKVWLNKETGARLTDDEYSAQTKPGERTSGVWVYDSAGIEEAATGGEVTKEGLLHVHRKEPIVPAEIARSSTLIDRLREISSGGGQSAVQAGSGGVQVTIQNLNVTAPSGSDPYSFARQIKEALDRELNDFEFSRRVEEAVRRACMAYVGSSG